MVMGRNECGSNAMVTVQMTVEEYLEMKSRQEAKEVTTKQKNLVYGLPSSAAARPQRGESRTANGSVRQSVRSVARSWSMQTWPWNWRTRIRSV